MKTRFAKLCRVRQFPRIALATLALVSIVSMLGPTASLQADSIDREIVAKAHRFLGERSRARAIVSSLHFGTHFKSHDLIELSHVTRNGKIVAGEFALTYRYLWGDGGKTDVVFFCDRLGRFTSLSIEDCNAVINQPFVVSDATIQVVGNMLIEAFKDEMSDDDRRTFQRFVNNSDSKGLLEWSLRIQQALGQ